MNGFMDKLSEKIMPLANLLGQNRYLTVLRDAFMLSFPLTMFGSIVVVINNLPFSVTQQRELYRIYSVMGKMQHEHHVGFCYFWYRLLFIKIL